MGFFDSLKSMISTIKNLAAEDEQEQKYLQMTTDAMSILPDEELVSAVETRMDKIVLKDIMNECEVIAKLPEEKRNVYVLCSLDWDVTYDSLCDFFAYYSEGVAPYVSRAFEAVSAFEHKKLFDEFISSRGIDLNHLEVFDYDTDEELERLEARYDFREFDEAYRALRPLNEYLAAYIRRNIYEF